MAKKGHHQGAVTWCPEVPEEQAWTCSPSWKGPPSDRMRAGKAGGPTCVAGSAGAGQGPSPGLREPRGSGFPPPANIPSRPSVHQGWKLHLQLCLPQSLCAHFPGTVLQTIPTCQTSWGPKGPGWCRQPATPTLRILNQVPPSRAPVAPKTNIRLRPAFSVLFLPRLKHMTFPAPTPKYLSLVITPITSSSRLSGTY